MFDDLQDLLIASGYVGIFLWAFIEGEVGMVLAGSPQKRITPKSA